MKKQVYDKYTIGLTQLRHILLFPESCGCTFQIYNTEVIINERFQHLNSGASMFILRSQLPKCDQVRRDGRATKASPIMEVSELLTSYFCSPQYLC